MCQNTTTSIKERAEQQQQEQLTTLSPFLLAIWLFCLPRALNFQLGKVVKSKSKSNIISKSNSDFSPPWINLLGIALNGGLSGPARLVSSRLSPALSSSFSLDIFWLSISIHSDYHSRHVFCSFDIWHLWTFAAGCPSHFSNGRRGGQGHQLRQIFMLISLKKFHSQFSSNSVGPVVMRIWLLSPAVLMICGLLFRQSWNSDFLNDFFNIINMHILYMFLVSFDGLFFITEIIFYIFRFLAANGILCNITNAQTRVHLTYLKVYG